MAHFAEILDGVVQRVIVVHDNYEANGAQFCHDLLGGVWVAHDSVSSIFSPPQPFESWTLDSNNNWQPPTAMPVTVGPYRWNEEELEWVKLPQL